jgi:hypothetical protein
VPAALLIGSAAASLAGPQPLLQMVGDFRLPGAASRRDYMSIDPSGARLVLAHLGDSDHIAVRRPISFSN